MRIIPNEDVEVNASGTVAVNLSRAIELAQPEDDCGNLEKDDSSSLKDDQDQPLPAVAPSQSEQYASDAGIPQQIRAFKAVKEGSPVIPVCLRSESDTAQALLDRYGDTLRYSPAQKYWFLWNGTRWIHDPAQTSFDLVSSLADYIDAECIRQDLTGVRKKLIGKAVLKLRSGRYQREIMKIAQRKVAYHADPGDLDADPYLINCSNGIVDLRTGNLLPHHPKHLCSLQTNISFPDYDAPTPIFDLFWSNIVQGHRIQGFGNVLMRIVGYWLTGLTNQKYFFLIQGRGDSGKTTFCKLLYWILGEFYCTPNKALLLKSRGGRDQRHNYGAIVGKRVANFSEFSASDRLDDGAIKSLSGNGATNQGEYKFGRQFDFVNTAKIVIDSNYVPKMPGGDQAFYNRFLYLDFPNSFSEGKDGRIEGLDKKLKSELPGIFRKFAKAAGAVIENGLDIPPEMRETAQSFHDAEDSLADWIDASIVDLKAMGIDDNRARALALPTFVKTRELHKDYEVWAEENNVQQPLTINQLTVALKDRGYQWREHQGKDRKPVIDGISTKARLNHALHLEGKAEQQAKLPDPPCICGHFHSYPIHGSGKPDECPGLLG